MSFTYVLHARPLRICIRTPSSAPIDRSPGGFWDSAKVSYLFMRNDHPLWWKVKGQTCTPSPESSDPWRKQIAFGQYIDVWPRKAAGFGTCILKGTMEHYGTWPWEISPLMIAFLERHPEIVGQGDCPFHCMSMFEYPRAVWIFVSRNCRQI